jgi:hypothetical protein
MDYPLMWVEDMIIEDENLTPSKKIAPQGL